MTKASSVPDPWRLPAFVGDQETQALTLYDHRNLSGAEFHNPARYEEGVVCYGFQLSARTLICADVGTEPESAVLNQNLRAVTETWGLSVKVIRQISELLSIAWSSPIMSRDGIEPPLGQLVSQPYAF